jgi:hypothetical protein
MEDEEGLLRDFLHPRERDKAKGRGSGARNCRRGKPAARCDVRLKACQSCAAEGAQARRAQRRQRRA